MKRLAALGLALAVALGGCSSDSGEPDGPPTIGRDGQPIATCSPVATQPPPTNLPVGFPTPDGVGYYSNEKAGPTTILQGYWIGVSLGEAFEGWKRAFTQAGYQITDEEREEFDAEVNFAGGDSTGQVRLDSDTCAGIVMVGVTIRPGS